MTLVHHLSESQFFSLSFCPSSGKVFSVVLTGMLQMSNSNLVRLYRVDRDVEKREGVKHEGRLAD